MKQAINATRRPLPGAGEAGFRIPVAVKTEAGLVAEYFLCPGLDRPFEQDIAQAPAVEAVAVDRRRLNDWSVRFSGCLIAPAGGECVFRAEADTGVRLRIADKLVIDGWGKDGARTGRATLAKGVSVPVVVEYCFDRGQGGKAAARRLFWTPPAARRRWYRRRLSATTLPWFAPRRPAPPPSSYRATNSGASLTCNCRMAG